MGDPNEKRKRMSCALEINNPVNLLQTLHSVCADGYHFIVTNLAHPMNCRDLTDKEPTKIIGRTDRVLQSVDWSKLIVGKISRAYEVDNEIEHIRESEKLLLKQELGFASHLVLPAIMIKLQQGQNRNLAHILYNKFQLGVPFQVWVQMPIRKASSPFVQKSDNDESWETWNDFRRIANYHKKLGIVLELPKLDQLPSKESLERWCGEPVKALILHTSHFIPNPHNQPVLPKVYQEIIKLFMALDVQYVIQGPSTKFSYNQYYSYMNFLGKKLYENTVFNEFSLG